MEIGVPKETKDQEFRVGLSPSSVRVLCEAGHAVFVEVGAGVGAGFTDEDYQHAGAQIVSKAADTWNRELVVKWKEPFKSRSQYSQTAQPQLTYLHLAAG